MSIEHTAKAMGVSKGWACQLRRSFINEQMLPKLERVTTPGAGSGRGRAYLSHQQEQEFLLPFVDKACQAGILIVSEIRQALEKSWGE